MAVQLVFLLEHQLAVEAGQLQQFIHVLDTYLLSLLSSVRPSFHKDTRFRVILPEVYRELVAIQKGHLTLAALPRALWIILSVEVFDMVIDMLWLITCVVTVFTAE